MTGPSNSPRGERPGKPGITWESWAEWLGEQHVPDQDTSTPAAPLSETATRDANQPGPPAPPNRATRRALARQARRNR